MKKKGGRGRGQYVEKQKERKGRTRKRYVLSKNIGI